MSPCFCGVTFGDYSLMLRIKAALMFDVCQHLVCVDVFCGTLVCYLHNQHFSRVSRRVYERSRQNTTTGKMDTSAANHPWDFGQAVAELSSGIIKGFVVFLGL